ncbi:hypothetical protein [Methylobacterium haplocladii]|uniref:Heme exporter protein D n=1 Tax=Methylobacterium haplocladii TaxID=1176176 RepID=A0A512IQY0_9HYPH|nr:hypothetical protein [Methylobacterium haplocladii]GEP00076.1 hypothetical protein MHA02_24630 [Methylobacterium haplocladii]GLS61256.1 hypothetical protein GCM10007887_39540 [Methylobacterium haplocladii]
MSSHAFASVEAGLVIVVVFGLAVWQLVAVRRSIRRDRQTAGGQEARER